MEKIALLDGASAQQASLPSSARNQQSNAETQCGSSGNTETQCGSATNEGMKEVAAAAGAECMTTGDDGEDVIYSVLQPLQTPDTLQEMFDKHRQQLNHEIQKLFAN